MQHVLKFCKVRRVVFELCELTDRQTDKQTDTLIIILRSTTPRLPAWQSRPNSVSHSGTTTKQFSQQLQQTRQQ